jgi:hypothetical protein
MVLSALSQLSYDLSQEKQTFVDVFSLSDSGCQRLMVRFSSHR